MDVKNIAEKGAKLFAAKKALQWSGGLLKVGAIAGAGYLGYKYYKKNQEKIDSTVKNKIDENFG